MVDDESPENRVHTTAVQPESTSDSQAEDERQIRMLAAAWSKALEYKDPAGLTAGYAPDVVLFYVKPPFQTTGPAAIRQLWEACLPYFPATFSPSGATSR